MRIEKGNVFLFLSVLPYLMQVYESTKKEQKTYSYHKFSEDLGLGKSTLVYQVINGMRPLTHATAARIAQGLKLSRSEKKYFLALHDYQSGKTHQEKDEAFSRILEIRAQYLKTDLDRRITEFVSQWYHPVVRELVNAPGFQAHPEWIANHCFPEITVEQATHSFALLQRLGFVQFDMETERWVQSEPVISMPPEIASLALMRLHSQLLDLAKDSLRTVEAREREISGVMLSLNKEEISQIKNEIQEFRKELLKKYAHSTDPSQTIQISLQMFPVSKKY